MDADDDVTELLRRTLRAIEPWSDEIVLIGGWAIQMYRYAEWADSNVDIVLTEDVDFAVPKQLESTGELNRRLMDQGLVRIASRATNPAITYFQIAEHGSEDLAPSYVEFLTPFIGPSQYSDPVVIAPNVTAQCLRYLELSFDGSLLLPLARVPTLADTGVASIRIPSPASYLLAKALVYPRRGNRRDKDCAYIYWLARITRQIWEDVRRDLDALNIPPRWRARGYEQLRVLFGSERGEGPVRAARSLANPDHSEGIIRRVVQKFLRALGVIAQ